MSIVITTDKQKGEKVGVCKSIHSCAVISALAVVLPTRGEAGELGYAGVQVQPGVGIAGTTAASPPPGLYAFDQAFTYQARIAGPGAPKVGGSATTLNVNTGISGLLWAPGWTIFGATYDAVLVQPVGTADLGAPINSTQKGMANTYLIPGELSWRLGDSGFFVKANFGVSVPVDVSGPTGLGGMGNPWWTFRPGLIVSYLKDGWSLTAAVYAEINTKNSITGYRSGNVIDAEFSATKSFGKWRVGPIGYYVGQVGDDTSSAFYGYAVNVNRYNIWAAGGLVGYDFGPVQLNVWGAKEVFANASGGTSFNGIDSATTTQGFKLFASVSYRLWAPDQPASAPAGRRQFTR